MKKSLIGAALLGLLLATGSVFAADDAEARCREFAQEEGVKADEMDDYMAQCIEDQRAAESEESEKGGND